MEQEVPCHDGKREERGSSSLQKDVKLSREWMQNALVWRRLLGSESKDGIGWQENLVIVWDLFMIQ